MSRKDEKKKKRSTVLIIVNLFFDVFEMKCVCRERNVAENLRRSADGESKMSPSRARAWVVHGDQKVATEGLSEGGRENCVREGGVEVDGEGWGPPSTFRRLSSARQRSLLNRVLESRAGIFVAECREIGRPHRANYRLGSCSWIPPTESRG